MLAVPKMTAVTTFEAPAAALNVALLNSVSVIGVPLPPLENGASVRVRPLTLLVMKPPFRVATFSVPPAVVAELPMTRSMVEPPMSAMAPR